MNEGLSVCMFYGIKIFLDKKIQLSLDLLNNFWNRNHTSDGEYVKSIERNREHFQSYIGAIDELILFRSFSLKSNPPRIDSPSGI